MFVVFRKIEPFARFSFLVFEAPQASQTLKIEENSMTNVIQNLLRVAFGIRSMVAGWVGFSDCLFKSLTLAGVRLITGEHLQCPSRVHSFLHNKAMASAEWLRLAP